MFAQMSFRMMLESIAEVIPKNSEECSTPPTPPVSGDMSPNLKNVCITLECASSGEVGWEMLHSGGFDLAVVDIHMPGASGFDISWAYQHHLLNGDGGRSSAGAEPPRQTIIIACTADDDCNQDSLRRYGMHDLLRKPVSVKALRHMLHKWLPRTDIDTAGSVPLLRTPFGQHLQSSGQFAGRVLLVEDCVVRTIGPSAFSCGFLHLPRIALLPTLLHSPSHPPALNL